MKIVFASNNKNKIHEIQFTYNLLKDNANDLMDEIQYALNRLSELR